MEDKWFHDLPEEDRNFIKRFVLASGSIKDLAKQYKVSYPTLRLRLDRLIEKIRIIDSPKENDPFKMKIQLMVAESQISTHTAKEIIREYNKSKEE